MPKILTKQSLRFLIYAATILIFFYLFSFLVKEDFFTRFDFDATVRVQNVVPRAIDPFFSYFSLLGSFEMILGILVLALFVRRKLNNIFLIGMFGLMHVVELVGKAFLDHPATPFMFHRYSFDFVFPTGYVQPGGSYPSGHSMRTVYLALLLIFMINRSNLSSTMKQLSNIAIIVFIFLMLFSRVSLGEHWTTDVIGGSLLGVSFALFSLIIL